MHCALLTYSHSHIQSDIFRQIFTEQVLHEHNYEKYSKKERLCSCNMHGVCVLAWRDQLIMPRSQSLGKTAKLNVLPARVEGVQTDTQTEKMPDQ